MSQDLRVRIEPRPITTLERSVLERMLSVDLLDVEFFRRQVDAITVIGACSCGCGTVSFDVDQDRAAAAPPERWRATGGPFVDHALYIFLFQSGGVLTELEFAGDGPPPFEVRPDEIHPKVDHSYLGLRNSKT